MNILIIDSNNIAHIQRHAFGEDLTWQEEQTGILWGFFNQIFKLAEQFNTNRFVFVWDSKESKRREIYSEYKSNRQRFTEDTRPVGVRQSDERIYSQFNSLKDKLLLEFGFRNVLEWPGYEADDIIASIVLNQSTIPIDKTFPTVVSTDKDLYQLLEYCDIWRPITKELITSESFQEKHGMLPHQWVDIRAMAGDVSDNIPGIAGVGEGKALQFLHGKMNPGTKTRNRIVSAEGQEIVERNKKLMCLPLPGTPKFAISFEYEKFMVDDFLNICDRYGFQNFLKQENLRKWRSMFNMREDGKAKERKVKVKWKGAKIQRKRIRN